MKTQTTAQVFENAIARQEKRIYEAGFAWLNETPEQFNEKIATRIRMVCVGLGHAREIDGIEQICRGLDATWNGFYVQRRRVDQLDNVYVSRAR